MTRERRWLLSAIAFSLVVRLAIAAAVLVTRHDVTAFHTDDSARYLQLGASLAHRQGFAVGGVPEVFRLPGFPLLVAAATWLGHATLWTVMLQAILGAITTWICFRWADAIAGPRAGLWAAWLYALEPGQWAWSSLLLTETLFTTLLATALLFGTTYLKNGRRSALLWAAVAATGCAYVRIVGYPLAIVLVLACVVLAGRIDGRRTVWRDGAVSLALVFALLGPWHVRNGVQSGYWGFSSQVERAGYLVAAGVMQARDTGSYRDAVAAIGQEVDDAAGRQPGAVASEMRRRGLAQIRQDPFAFLSAYGSGVVATLVHPGSGAFLRLLDPHPFQATTSVTQMVTLSRWRDAWRIVKSKGTTYWIVTAPLFATTLLYLGLFLAAAWRGRRHALILLPCSIVAAVLLCSGGPDGDSRRRAPLVPLMCVVIAAASVVTGIAGKPFDSLETVPLRGPTP